MGLAVDGLLGVEFNIAKAIVVIQLFCIGWVLRQHFDIQPVVEEGAWGEWEVLAKEAKAGEGARCLEPWVAFGGSRICANQVCVGAAMLEDLCALESRLYGKALVVLLAGGTQVEST